MNRRNMLKSMGIGAFYSDLSDDFKDLTRIVRFDTANIWGGEMYYNYEVNPWFHSTADVQVVQGANDNDDPALVLGLRAVLDF